MKKNPFLEEEEEEDFDVIEEDDEEELSPLMAIAEEKAGEEEEEDLLGEEEEFLEEEDVASGSSPLANAMAQKNAEAEVPNPGFTGEPDQMDLKEQVQGRKGAAGLRAERLNRLEKLLMQVDEELHDNEMPDPLESPLGAEEEEEVFDEQLA